MSHNRVQILRPTHKCYLIIIFHSRMWRSKEQGAPVWFLLHTPPERYFDNILLCGWWQKLSWTILWDTRTSLVRGYTRVGFEKCGLGELIVIGESVSCCMSFVNCGCCMNATVPRKTFLITTIIIIATIIWHTGFISFDSFSSYIGFTSCIPFTSLWGKPVTLGLINY